MTFILRIVAAAICGLWMRWVSPVVRLPVTARAGIYVAGGLRALLSAARLLAADASFGIGYLPWLIPLVFIVTGRQRGALPHLVAAAGYVAFLIVIYARSSDASIYVAWSSTRVLLTPVLFFVFAALSAVNPTRGNHRDAENTEISLHY